MLSHLAMNRTSQAVVLELVTLVQRVLERVVVTGSLSALTARDLTQIIDDRALSEAVRINSRVLISGRGLRSRER